MNAETVFTLLTALGAAGVISTVVTAVLNRRRNSVEITQIIRDMSKQQLLDAKGNIDDLTGKIDGLKVAMQEQSVILRDLVVLVERDVIPALPDHPETRHQLRLITSRARKAVA